MNEPVCEVCGSPVKPREGWVDDGYEYRHIEYSECGTCEDIRTSDGRLILQKPDPSPNQLD